MPKPAPKFKVEDQSFNGVKVKVFRYRDGTTHVEADCTCFGIAGRVHSHPHCPVLKSATEAAGRVTVRANSTDADISKWLTCVSDKRLHALNSLVYKEGVRRGFGQFWSE